MSIPLPRARWRRIAVAVGAFLLAGAAFAAPAESADIAPAKPAVDSGMADDAAWLDSAVRAYRASYPQMSAATARTVAAQQAARKSLYTELIRESGNSSFGGAWLDAPSGVFHVAVTTADAQSKATTAGSRLGLRVQTHLVQRSFAELERQAAALRGGTGTLGRAARGQVGIDVQSNQVVAAVQAGRQATLAGDAPAGVKVVTDPNLNVKQDACDTRAFCDDSLRAGSIIREDPTGVRCSMGFTARNFASNQRYLLTAGHCSSGNGNLWTVGNQAGGPQIGVMEASVDNGVLDVGAIRVTDARYNSSTRGELFHPDVPGKSLPLTDAAPSLAFMFPGDVVCLAANFADPGGPNYCGTILTISDPFTRGLVRVTGYDACDGDSGGGWYWRASATSRWAFGIHWGSGSLLCSSSLGSSWFTAIPLVFSSFATNLGIEVG